MRERIRGMSGSDKKAFAQKMGVTVRTVQRWGITPDSGKQARNFLSKRIKDKPPESWATSNKQRANTSTALRNGISRVLPGAESYKTFTERFANYRDGMRFLRDLASGKADKWLNNSWSAAKLTKVGGQIHVEVTYGSGSGGYAGVGGDGAGGFITDGDLLPIVGVDDPFGDILYS